MKRFNLGKGSPKGSGEGGGSPGERQGPRKSILITGLVVMVLAIGYFIVTYFVPLGGEQSKTAPPPRGALQSLPQPQIPSPLPPAPAPPPEVTKLEPPSQEKPEAQPPKAEETVAASKAGPRYTLQVGAMIHRRSAMELQRRLQHLGYPAHIRKGTSPKTRYMVYIGEASLMHEAEATVRRLQRGGFPARVVSTKGGFLAGIGDFLALDEAIDLAHELQKKHHTPKIVDRRVLTTFHQVRVGSFDNKAEALTVGRELRGRGFDNFVVKD
ncbi:MAG: SPOR domain-containing protein [candidate division NC10 bacterium]|nr:SPOR domain-containing protein [candidate division NC10 bacterium]